MEYTLVGIGELLWDRFPTGKVMGGAPANFAYHARSLGAEGIIVSSIGNDSNGHEILTKLNGLSLNSNFIQRDNEHLTGEVKVTMKSDGGHSFEMPSEAAYDHIHGTPELIALAKRADAVCFGTYAQRNAVSRDTIRRFLNATGKETLKIFDINLRQSFYSKELIESSLALSNVLKLSEEELSVISGMFSLFGGEEDIIERLAKKFDLDLIAVTKGGSGSCLYSSGTFSHHSGYPVKVVDTVGAGDSFTAAIAIGILNKMEINLINNFANRIASFVCSQRGATPAIPQELINNIE